MKYLALAFLLTLTLAALPDAAEEPIALRIGSEAASRELDIQAGGGGGGGGEPPTATPLP